MTVANDRKRLGRHLDRLADVLVREGGVDEVIVVIGEEDPALDALGNPLLMQTQGGIVGDAEIEEGGCARHVQVKAVLLSCRDQAVAKLDALFMEQGGAVDALHFLNAGNSCRKGNGGEPVGARVGHRGHRVLEEVLSAHPSCRRVRNRGNRRQERRCSK